MPWRWIRSLLNFVFVILKQREYQELIQSFECLLVSRWVIGKWGLGCSPCVDMSAYTSSFGIRFIFNLYVGHFISIHVYFVYAVSIARKNQQMPWN